MTINEYIATVDRVLKRIELEERMKPELNAKDWAEIYYALDLKLNSASVQGSDRLSQKWRAHLRRIIKTIGPDGRNMTERGADVYHCDFACAKCGKATTPKTGCTDGAWVYCSDDCRASH